MVQQVCGLNLTDHIKHGFTKTKPVKYGKPINEPTKPATRMFYMKILPKIMFAKIQAALC